MAKNYKVVKYKIYLFLILSLLIFSFLFISCNQRSNLDNIVSNNIALDNIPQEKSLDSNQTSQTNQTNNNFQDYLVYTANIRGKVSSLEDFEVKIANLVKTSGGYISLIEKYNEDEIYIILKVPKANFYNDFSSIKKLFISIENERVQIEDISQQYIDLEARLNSKKEAEKRYLVIMQKANSVKDIIEIEQALRQIREEIESYEANLRYFNNSIQYSTIAVNAYIQKIRIKGENFWTRLVKSISIGFNSLISAFLFIISLWPFIIIALVTFFIILKLKNNKKKQKNENK